ncbi:MAG: BrxA/BrxB family bacilliredoxin [Bryobacteraceae bacterium]|nr:BrxA/BrxB family bacilliredoxin [Bryobacteraceae bacterium]MDW8376947.1 BrxA/BrxB family bacilliredoxin [Bryobacterales bacterium]
MNRYPEQLILPMRRDLTQYGVEEVRTPEAVDEALGPQSGSVLMVINSVCGCAAGKARPAVGMALNHPNRPDRAVTVFAGADVEAVQHLRATKLSSVPPSSPSIALFRNGELVFILHRHDIESSEAPQIAQRLTAAFDQYCATARV